MTKDGRELRRDFEDEQNRTRYGKAETERDIAEIMKDVSRLQRRCNQLEQRITQLELILVREGITTEDEFEASTWQIPSD